MESITSWTRLEPRTRSDDLGPALQARVHDPLWLVARQWQLGELNGDDAGSPAWVRVRADVSPLNGWLPGGTGTRVPYDGSLPLEALAEREPGPDPARDLALAAEAGLHFLRLLAAASLQAYRATFIDHHPLPSDEAGLDAESLRAVRVLRGRAPNAATLLPVLRAAAAVGGTFPPALGIAAGDVEAARSVAGRWVEWWDALYSRADREDAAWQAERMEYRFGVTAPGGNEGDVVLQAPEYHGGRLDWYDFVQAGGGALKPKQTQQRTRTVLPSPAAYPGMPVARWWEFEDARTDFGSVEAEPADLARLLLVEYATVYSNDWFLVPVELPVGAVCGVRSVVVCDTFGEKTLVDAAGTGSATGRDSWSLFRPSLAAGGVSSLFFMAPALPGPLEAPPVEEVRMLRDEMANMAWAVERKVESRTGRPIDRHEAWAARHGAEPPAPPPDPGAPLAYRLATEIPEHWFPLVPIPIQGAAGAMRLRRLDTQRRAGAVLETLTPRGRVLVPAVLDPGELLEVQEEEVPREGIRVTRAWQHARWTDGSTHVWIGRRKLPGQGEGSAGLRFDVAEPVATES